MNTMRELLDLWDESADQMTKDQIKQILDGGDFVLFFKKGNEVFASNEQSRVVFATMKNPDNELPKNWSKEANFMAIDLGKALEGYTVKKIFDKKDLKDIKIIDSEDMYQLLLKLANHNGRMNLNKVIKDLPDEDEPVDATPDNMSTIGEK